jgi:uncharacterized membrane protein
VPPFGLFLDKGLTHPLQKTMAGDKLVWIMDFGRLDAGEDKTFPVYLENQGAYAIEDLKVTIEPVNREGVETFISNGSAKRISIGEVHTFTVGWKVGKDAKLGRCTAHIGITGYVTE